MTALETKPAAAIASVALAARDLSFGVAGKILLHEVSLTLRPGELVGVVGLNGAGKSTLLKLLCGDYCPLAGHVTLNGRALDRWPRNDRARHLAVLPQELQLQFPLTVAEVALLGRAPHIRLRETPHDHHIARLALLLTGVADLAARAYPTLSGGERQRVQLARVLAQLWYAEPDVAPAGRYLLLDEPTASLDIAHQQSVLEVVRDFTRKGAGALAILHDLNLAARYCDRILVLHRAKLTAEGTPGDILSPSLIRDAFGISATILSHPVRHHPVVIPD